MDLGNAAHLHLLLNHVPTIGTVVAFGLLALSVIRKNDSLKRASLEVFCIIALVTLPAYLSGAAARAAIADRPDVSNTSIEMHQDAALLAFGFMELTGAVAWLGLWQFRRISRPARWNVALVLVLSLVTISLMARAATMGGEIRHPEIRSSEGTLATEATAGSEPGWFTTASIASFVTSYAWVWAAAETLHFIGLCLLFGVLLVVNLRLLGMMKHVSFAAMHRLLLWGFLGFGINFITGMLFFVSTPEPYMTNVAFYWKMALLMLAGGHFLYLTVFDQIWALAPGADAALRDKAVALSGIVLWVGVMYCGRMLPFLGDAF